MTAQFPKADLNEIKKFLYALIVLQKVDAGHAVKSTNLFAVFKLHAIGGVSVSPALTMGTPDNNVLVQLLATPVRAVRCVMSVCTAKPAVIVTQYCLVGVA